MIRNYVILYNKVCLVLIFKENLNLIVIKINSIKILFIIGHNLDNFIIENFI